MELKIIELADTYACFEISGITPWVANALRRTLIADIPKLAIHKIRFHHGRISDETGKIYDASTPLFDEIVAHRISLIPIPTDLSMNFRDECVCGGEGCPSCTVFYTLTKFGPGTVYSGDLRPVGDERFSPVDSLIPIVKLNAHQALMIEAEAIMGRARDHAKWQVTSGVAYKYHREIRVDKDECEFWEEVKEKCPSAVVEETDDYIVFTDDYGCPEVARVLSFCDCEVKEDDTRYIFRFETDGSLSAKDVLTYALRHLKERFGEVRERASLG